MIRASRVIVFVLFIFTSLISPLRAASSYEGISPLEWQIVKLQENIERKIIKSLKPVIKEDEYIIEVKIGVDKDAVESPTSKNITKTKQATKIKFTTAEVQKDGDDYVVFSKLGLEAPVFGDEPIEIQTSDAELSQKAFIEMNDRYNLFNYLKTIDINLTFDTGLSNKTKDVIRKVVQGLSFNINEVVPQINTQFLDLKANQIKGTKEEMAGAGAGAGSSKLDGVLKAQAEKKEAPKLHEYFKNLDVMIGLILAAAIIGLSLYFISKNQLKANELNKKNEEKAEDKLEDSEEETIDAEENLDNIEEEDDMKFDLTKTDPVTVRIAEGLERLRKAMANHHDDTILMLKGWIKSKTINEVNALSSIVAMYSDEELANTFKTLTHNERATWKAVLHSELSKEEVSNSFGFISNKITEMMMVPSLIEDYETCDLLLGMSSKDAAKFCEEDIELAVVFTNVLSSNVIGEMFKIISPDLVADLIDRSATFNTDELPELLPALKVKLEQIKAKREKPPFLKRIIEILPSANADIEPKLYSTLLKHFTADEVKVTALKIFPTILVPEISAEVFKQVVALMPMDVQVQYFASMENEERDEMLNKFAAKGSKSREMIDVELVTILKNEVMLRRLQNDKRSKLEQEFISYTRQLVSTNQEIQREVIDQIEAWFSEINDEDLTQKLSA